MRVTQSMINRSVLKSVEDSRSNLSAIQNQITTSKRVESASDDPVSFSRSQNYKNTLQKNSQYLQNVAQGRAWMDMSYAILNELHDLVLDAKDMALKGADDANGANERAIMSTQVEALLQSAVSLGNTQFQGKYLFGGTITTEEDPFLLAGDSSVTYQGNSEAITRRIYENYDITVNVAGDEIVDSGLFSNIKALMDGLASNDRDSINSLITDLDESSTELLSTISRMSSVQNQASMTEIRLQTANTNLESYISDTEDVDMADAIARYGIEEVAYQSALQITARAINLNILNFID